MFLQRTLQILIQGKLTPLSQDDPPTQWNVYLPSLLWSSGIVKYIALQPMMDFMELLKISPFQLRMVLWHREIRSIVLTPVWNCVVHSLTGIFHVVPGGWLQCSWGPMNSREWRYLHIDYSQVNHGNHSPGHFHLHFYVYGITPNEIQSKSCKDLSITNFAETCLLWA